MFNIKAGFEVVGLNRDKEIFIERELIKKYLIKKYKFPCEFEDMSCEMIAREILEFGKSNGMIWCEVFEEKTGGAKVPNKKIIGLSKLARTLDQFSRRLQNQERITIQVAEFLQNELDPQGVAVVLKAKHMCMEMRGVKKHDTWTTTSKMIGVFKENEITRNEFLSLIK